MSDKVNLLAFGIKTVAEAVRTCVVTCRKRKALPTGQGR